MKSVADSDLFPIIGALQARYIHALDDGDCREWPELFVDDCFYKVTTADNHAQNLEGGLIWLEGKAMLRDRILSLSEANIYERHKYRHMLNPPRITGREGDEVDAETTFLVVRITRGGPSDLFATGRYIDRYRLRAGTALLARRIVILDSGHIDTLLGLPL